VKLEEKAEIGDFRLRLGGGDGVRQGRNGEQSDADVWFSALSLFSIPVR
jgi:hypothetical protein